MRSKKLKIVLGIIFIIITIFACVLITKTILKTDDKKDLINIFSLSEEFMDNYFEEVSEVKEEDKENILIVTSKEELNDIYGAVKVIKAPNNQYFLQYETKEDKEQALENFNNNNSIDVSENIIHEISENTVLVADYNSWGVEAMGLDSLKEKMANHTLEDVVVAIIDTGLDVNLFNEKYPDRLAGYYNVLDSKAEMTDEEGHGTHIAGTIAESTSDNVQIFPVKVSKTKYIYEMDIITGINYIVDNNKADVMNMSFGSYGYSTGEYLAIEAGLQNNIISVAAAGNDNVSDLHYPSAFDNTIAIAAVDSTKQKASFSNYGDYVMFTSPGVDILSINGTMSGTSMATPHAASAVAILKTLNKELNFDSTITILRRYSDDLGDISWDEYYGFGFINFETAEICDGTNCDEYNVFKKSSRDDLEDVIDNYEIEPNLTVYNYGTINNILNTKIIINYTNGKSIEYKLYNIKNLELSNYDPFSTEKQEVSIKFTTSLGLTIDDSFEVTNPSSYESVWEYNVLNNNNIELTNFKDVDSTVNTLYIPEEIDGYAVTAIANGSQSIFKDAWTAFSKVNYLYLPSTLTRVGDHAFNGGSLGTNGLSYVKSEAEKLEVGELAFTSSRSLITLDANLSYIGDYAFYWADQLMNVKFSDELTYIGTYAFNYGLNGAKLEIPENVTTIGNGAFLNSGLKEIIFKNTMETIPERMFETSSSEKDYKFNQLEKVVLPDGLKEIGNSAFKNRSNLKSINIPETVTSIGDSAFQSALSEVTIIIPKDVTYLGNNVFKNSNIKEIIFNNNILEIPDSMFSGMTNLEKVVLPDGLKRIGNQAFRNCEKLKEINLPVSLTEIGASAFNGALKDISLTIPKNVSTIGSNVFQNSGLKEIKFTNTIEKIPNYMFSGSLDLEKVTLPDGLKEIGNTAFSGCSKLKEINFPESLTTIGNYAFETAFDIESNISLEIPENILSIGDYTFYKSNIKEIVFNNSMEKIPDYAFWLSNNLEKVILPEGLKEIGNYAFAGCKKLKEINLPESLITIGNNVFGAAFDTESNVTIIIPENVTSIGKEVFKGSNVYEVIFENNLEKITDSMFYNNLYLEKVTLPEGLKEIGYFAFQSSNKIQKINLPESLTKIEAGAFEDCSSLKEVYFGKNVVEIGDDAFLNLPSRVIFYVYNNTNPKIFAETNNINYVQIDPDVISVKNIKSQYSAFEKVNKEDVLVELTYNEKSTRIETITENIEIEYPDSREDLRFGDTSIKVITYNELGYKIEKSLEIEVIKATPNYEIPKNLVAEIGQKLYDIQLPDNFEWTSDNITFENNGNQKFIVRYIPNDTENYKTIEDIEINIAVGDCKKIIKPTIEILDKTFDGEKKIDIENITISELSKTDYTIISAQALTENVGITTAKVLIKLSDEKFKNYTFEGGVQEKEFEVSVNIVPKSINKPTLVEKTYIYNSLVQTIELTDFNEEIMSIEGNKRIGAGEQFVVISLKNNNYVWDDGTSMDVILIFKIDKATPEYTIPTDLTADVGQKISEVQLPKGFEWMNSNEVIEKSGKVVFQAKYIPINGVNYNTIENIDITINVNPKIYTITFNSNNEKNLTLTQEIEYNKQTKLNENTFTKNGYKFVGWNTKQDGTGTIYNDEQEIIITENLILYAQWEETYSYVINKYSVDETNKIIKGIPINTTEDQFRSNINLNVGYTLEIVKQKDKSNIGTNTFIKIYKDGILYKEFTAIVKGDITGDGLISLADLSRFYNYYQKNITMNKYFESAADVKEDGNFSLADLSKFYNYYQGKINKL